MRSRPIWRKRDLSASTILSGSLKLNSVGPERGEGLLEDLIIVNKQEYTGQ